jgi:hypothetical protein
MFQPTQPTQAATAPPPVVPEEAIIGDAPAKALDPLVGEQSILDKARDMAKPVRDISLLTFLVKRGTSSVLADQSGLLSDG